MLQFIAAKKKFTMYFPIDPYVRCRELKYTGNSQTEFLVVPDIALDRTIHVETEVDESGSVIETVYEVVKNEAGFYVFYTEEVKYGIMDDFGNWHPREDLFGSYRLETYYSPTGEK